MRRMFAKACALATALSLIVGGIPVSANETAESTAEIEAIDRQREEVVLSLKEAIDLALENNAQLKANDASIKSAILALDVVNEQTKEYKKTEKDISKIPGASMAVNISNGLEQAYLKHGYYVDAAQVGYDLALMQKEQTMASVAYDVTEKYYTVKLMEELIKISETGLQIARENEEIVKKNYELGYVSELEVKNVESSVKSTTFSLEANRRNLEIATESLLIALSLDQSDVSLVLTDEITLPEIPENYEEKIENAMETRYDVTALKKSKDIKEKYFEITSMYMSDKTSAYHTAYSDSVTAEYTYDNSSKLIKLSMKNDYASILSAKDAVTTAENTLEIKNIEYESSKIKFEMGMITNLELTSAMAELDSAKVQLENARLSYLLSVLKFEYNTTIGI